MEVIWEIISQSWSNSLEGSVSSGAVMSVRDHQQDVKLPAEEAESDHRYRDGLMVSYICNGVLTLAFKIN